MRLAIIGSREFTDYDKLCDILLIHFNQYNFKDENYQYVFDTIVSGGAKGADSLAARFAKNNGIKLIEHIPDWSAGKGAGFARNHDIIANSDFILAFWNGSPGTKHSLSLAKKLKKPTLIIYF